MKHIGLFSKNAIGCIDSSKGVYKHTLESSSIGYITTREVEYLYFVSIMRGNIPISHFINEGTTSIVVDIPSSNNLEDVDYLRLEYDRAFFGGNKKLSITEVDKLGYSTPVFDFVEGQDLPIIQASTGSEIMLKLLENNDNIEFLTNLIYRINREINYKDEFKLFKSILRFLRDQKIIPGIWEDYRTSTDVLSISDNPGLLDECIRKALKGILYDMTGNDWIIEYDRDKDRQRVICDMEIFLQNTGGLHIKNHGSGVNSVLKYIPSFMLALKQGDLCFIGGLRGEMLCSWHKLIKDRFFTHYIPWMYKILNITPKYNQIIVLDDDYLIK